MMDRPAKESIAAACYTFGPFRLEASERRLSRDGKALSLQPKIFDTLVLLVASAGHLMTKETLMAALWPDAVVEESNLTKNIWTIRRLLGDSEGGGLYIETVPRVGYRFVAAVRADANENPEERAAIAPDGAEPTQPAVLATSQPESLLTSAPLPPPGSTPRRRLGPYEILGPIGAGGMGEVFRARDERLKRDVAIKVLPPSFSHDPERLRRFEQEAQAAGALNHPNITAVYDVGSHEGSPYIVTELLDGEELASRLAAGPLAVRKSIDYATQIAKGLAAAHEKGIVHRDLKPDNVFVTRDGRVKILDFGLAKLTQIDTSGQITNAPVSTAGTEPGVVLGTMGYMSPEQVRGLPADRRSDIFSFGAVLYEMLTGRRAFERETAAETMTAILKEEPLELSETGTSIPPALERIVHHCLEKSPEERFQSAHDLAFDLASLAAASGTAPSAGEAPAIDSSTVSALPPSKRRSRIAMAGVAAIVLAAAVFVATRPRPRSAPRSAAARAAPVHVRRSIAVLGLKNLSGRPEADWLATALSAMVTAELAAGETLRVVPAENVARRRLTLPAGTLSAETLSDLRNDLNADEVVLGSYVAILSPGGEQIRVDLLVQDAGSGETLASVSETGTEANLFQLVSAAGQELRAKLGLETVSAPAAASVEASLPRSPEAARLYADGLGRLLLVDASTAKPLLERAIELEPQFPLAHHALSSAWSALGYEGKALQEAKKAVDMGQSLSREDKLALKGRFEEVSHDYPAAVETFRALAAFFPDNVEYGLRLAQNLVRVGRNRDASEVLASLHRLPPPSGADPRIDYVVFSAAQFRGDWQASIENADRTIRGAIQRHAPQLAARAWLGRAYALDALGRLDEKRTADEEAIKLFRAAGDLDGEAKTLISLGNITWAEGNPLEAERFNTRALDTFRKVGDKSGMAVALSNLSSLRRLRGDIRRAAEYGRETLALDTEVDNRVGTVWALANLGEILSDEGDIQRAASLQREALDLAQKGGDNAGTIYALSALAGTLRIEGDLKGAEKNIQEALSRSRKAEDVANIASRLDDLAALSLDRGDLGAADRAAREALSIQEKTKLRQDAANSRLLLARINTENSSFREAAVNARLAAEEFHQEELPPGEAVARSVLSRALLDGGDRTGALGQSRAAVGLLRGVEENATLIPVDLGAARIEALAGDPARARLLLAAGKARAVKTNWQGYLFEERLLDAELTLRQDRFAGLRELDALSRDAESKGFKLVASKARADAASPPDARPHH